MAEIRELAQKAAQNQTPLWENNTYYADAEKYIDSQWETYIWPRIKDCDFRHIIDLACGQGRNSEKLLNIVDKRLTLVDLAKNNIKACQERFKGKPGAEKIRYVVGDGVSIPTFDNAVSLVYCWDAMVHFPPEVVYSYLQETYRALQPGGMAFFHHSNFSGNDNIHFGYNPHARNHMTKNLFCYWAKVAGLRIISSDIIDWGSGAYTISDLDCITVLKKGA